MESLRSEQSGTFGLETTLFLIPNKMISYENATYRSSAKMDVKVIYHIMGIHLKHFNTIASIQRN
jgi:hypothetical protein